MNYLSEHPSRIHYTLRTASAMCFIGHGLFGIITKPIWCNYFSVFGIGHDLSYHLMPWVGGIDVLMGIVLLLFPLRFLPTWLVVWGTVTALLRPLSGEPFPEFLERAGNFGAPLALLILSGGIPSLRSLFSRLDPDHVPSERARRQLQWCLRIVCFLLLLGHGWLNLLHKEGLVSQYRALGFANPIEVASRIGVAEILFGLAALVKPWRPMILLFLLWKMGSEMFYPQYGLVEWIERGGSYGSLLALWLVSEQIFPWPSLSHLLRRHQPGT